MTRKDAPAADGGGKTGAEANPAPGRSTRFYAAVSIAAALATVGLKVTAYGLTDSVGLLSDAAESSANLVAAVGAFWALSAAARPPDEEHAYGHTKAEFFSSAVEGALVLAAAAFIATTAVGRLYDPQPLENVGVGLVVSANIVWVGLRILNEAAHGLLDTALPPEDLEVVEAVISRYREEGIEFHALRTRSAGVRRFVSMHVLVPGTWSVRRGHDLSEDLERDVVEALPMTTVFVHLEPLEDESSFRDQGLDRPDVEEVPPDAIRRISDG